MSWHPLLWPSMLSRLEVLSFRTILWTAATATTIQVPFRHTTVRYGWYVLSLIAPGLEPSESAAAFVGLWTAT